MTEAWQKRQYERQKFHDEWVGRVFDAMEMASDEVESQSDSFLFELVQIVFEFLGEMHSLAEPVKPNFTGTSIQHDAARRFWVDMHSAYDLFARSEAERDSMLATFLQEKLLPPVLNHFHANLLKEQMENPRQIYHASNSMEEAEIEP